MNLLFFFIIFFLENLVTVSWKHNIETDLAGYRLYIGSKPRLYDNLRDTPVPNDTSLYYSQYDTVITILPPDTSYRIGVSSTDTTYFSVTAFDVSGNESDYSVEVSYPVVLTPNKLNMRFVKTGKLSLEDIVYGEILISADSYYELFVNDEFIGSSDLWRNGDRYIVKFRQDNIVQIYARSSGWGRMVIAEISIGNTLIYTNKDWYVRDTPDPRWLTSVFRLDSTWVPSTSYGVYTQHPCFTCNGWSWIKFGGIKLFNDHSKAEYIWSNGGQGNNLDDLGPPDFAPLESWFVYKFSLSPDTCTISDGTIQAENLDLFSYEVREEGGLSTSIVRLNSSDGYIHGVSCVTGEREIFIYVLNDAQSPDTYELKINGNKMSKVYTDMSDTWSLKSFGKVFLKKNDRVDIYGHTSKFGRSYARVDYIKLVK